MHLDLLPVILQKWIKKKVSFKSNISDKTIQGGIVVDDVGYTPINNFTSHSSVMSQEMIRTMDLMW